MEMAPWCDEAVAKVNALVEEEMERVRKTSASKRETFDRLLELLKESRQKQRVVQKNREHSRSSKGQNAKSTKAPKPEREVADLFLRSAQSVGVPETLDAHHFLRQVEMEGKVLSGTPASWGQEPARATTCFISLVMEVLSAISERPGATGGVEPRVFLVVAYVATWAEGHPTYGVLPLEEAKVDEIAELIILTDSLWDPIGGSPKLAKTFWGHLEACWPPGSAPGPVAAERSESALVRSDENGEDTSGREPSEDEGIKVGTDYAWMCVRGQQYDFGKGQRAEVIKHLHEEWGRSGGLDGCGLKEETLSEKIDASPSFAMRKLFGGHSALGTILACPSKGVWALYLNQAPPEE